MKNARCAASKLGLSLDLASEAGPDTLTPLSVHLPPFLGIDVNIKDNRGLTALDTVRDLPSQKSQQIAALIEGTGASPHCPWASHS